ncbi:hypothetical protein CEK26_001127 [Fusarium fujikuroi]|uniref:Uncharacterized protein n=1 Tax=Fusarium fujikuroi TaxID=5127 RepID=A0A5Q3CX72_FUSFU|nr:hypothetical protein CEK27_001127 [Fusarium fujikuroi]QGI76217.1 hypothetical protein CEK25_001123 [Fusarium fujikuroi]QGI89912.1 hypothetical protein CEK26_001127 [Fusarium fujikuroi]VTT56947.1 unnamed protein product [Fusarium fujikuroi]VTT80489.1 unnamed protein product [Fusarium fujikuroi]
MTEEVQCICGASIKMTLQCFGSMQDQVMVPSDRRNDKIWQNCYCMMGGGIGPVIYAGTKSMEAIENAGRLLDVDFHKYRMYKPAGGRFPPVSRRFYIIPCF